MVTQTYNEHSYDVDSYGHVNEASNNSIPGFKETTNFRPQYSNGSTDKKKGIISKFFSNMSRLGLNYEDKVIDNMRSIPADKNLLPKDFQLVNQDLFTMAASNWKVKTNSDKNFFDKDFPQKRDALRKLAVQPELEDILDTMTNEAVVYDTDLTFFVTPFIEEQELSDFKPKFRKQLTETMNKEFRRLYKMLNWRTQAWDFFKRWLVEGILAWEIVWDSLEKPTKIIGIVPVDAATLTRKFKNNKWYWSQFSGMSGKERVLLDSQIIYIAYDENSSLNRTSYLERLIRPYNIYRIVEQAQIIWTVTNASFKMQFTIPIKGMNKVNGTQTLNTAMNRYKEDIHFNADSGELLINGSTNMPFNKEYWVPEGDSGTPEISTIGGDGPDLSDNDQLKFFKNNLYKISKIPLNRFDQESGETWFGADAASVARTEIDFGRFVTRLRNTFSQIMIKPLTMQLACDFKELQDNKQVLEAIQLRWNSYNVFEEMMSLELMQKRVEHIQMMKDSMVDQDMNGGDVKFFSSKFLVEKYLGLSKIDLELNDKLKKEEIEELNLAGGEGSDNQDDI
jgi:G20 coat protein (fragment)|nr:MAG TPA: capsid assembly protein [Caudoviricetes sp.]